MSTLPQTTFQCYSSNLKSSKTNLGAETGVLHDGWAVVEGGTCHCGAAAVAVGTNATG